MSDEALQAALRAARASGDPRDAEAAQAACGRAGHDPNPGVLYMTLVAFDTARGDGERVLEERCRRCGLFVVVFKGPVTDAELRQEDLHALSEHMRAANLRREQKIIDLLVATRPIAAGELVQASDFEAAAAALPPAPGSGRPKWSPRPSWPGGGRSKRSRR